MNRLRPLMRLSLRMSRETRAANTAAGAGTAAEEDPATEMTDRDVLLLALQISRFYSPFLLA